jgi:hypothetical protein
VSASPALLDELRRAGVASGVAVELQALLAGLSIEGGPSGFLSLYGDSRAHPNAWAGPLDAFPDWPGVKTRRGRGPWTHAAGQWQDEPDTYREAAARTGRAGFAPQDQIVNNADIASHDFAARSGLDLVETLQAGRLRIVQAYLEDTWPYGANDGLEQRYQDNLALLRQPPPPPPPPPPTERVLDTITDAAGRKIEIVERISQVAIVMMLLAGAGTVGRMATPLLPVATTAAPGTATGGELIEPPPELSSAPSPSPSPAWRFGQAEGRLTVECRQHSGDWQLCPQR